MTYDDPQVEVAPATEAQPVTAPVAEPAPVPEPAAVAEPVVVPEPAAIAEPAAVPEPAAVAEPVAVPEPAAGPEPVAVAEPEGSAELGGYAELRVAGQIGVTGNPFLYAQRVRPSLEIAPAEGALAGRLKAEAVLEATLTEGRDVGKEVSDTLLASEVGDLLTLAGCAYSPEPRYNSISDVLAVERLHVDFNLESLDLKIGRQAIRWGSGLYFHPTDLYAEVLLTEPWREPKGNNAIKATVPINGSDVTAVVAVGDDLSPFFQVAQGTAEELKFAELPLSAALRGTLRLPGVDIAAIGLAKADQSWFVGGDVRGTLGVGYWVEGGWHGPTDEVDGYGEVVAGLDYSLPLLENFYIAAEYRYDGSGSAPEDYDYASMLSGSLPFDCPMLPTAPTVARTSLGRHYIAGVTRLVVTQDFNLQAAAIVNLADGTAMLVPGAGVIATDRIAVNVSAQIPVGSDGEFKPADSALQYTLGTASVDLTGLKADATVTGWVRYSF